MKILVLNAGSSSQKCCLYQVAGAELPARMPAPLWEAETDGDKLKVSTSAGQFFDENIAAASSSSAISHLLETLWSGPTAVLQDKSEIDIVGHRVVHGGRDFRVPTRITNEVKIAIERLSPLAPAHNPAALAGIKAVEALLGDVPQVAVFDTAFHASLPDAAAIYPIPFEWTEQGIRRYGFHGISHADCAARAAQILGRELDSLRLITCHLGNGCSLCAIQGGKSIDTTMGFTPLEGLMMGTRSGSIDPGITLYLLREKGVSADELDHILNRESGLKGVSGLSGDMREIDAARAKGSPRALLAFEVYVHRLRAQIGAMLASLGGIDALIFTGGVGEHSAEVRAAVCEVFGFLGISLDSTKNESAPENEDIGSPESAVRVFVIGAQEDWAIARECWKLAA
ncbi:acetate kinase [Abditibacterium utsteinense]|uniref:Acetate kinase n=1 Tax=Abditibacterium utsteinense TaxID=1960156 RepID=A0A2S8SPF0_9BACT|nr:acetate kinase [Abditibacterium utsteinense]PQV62670.1 acetate kinase [Abditibacterium utsteinense]